MLLLLFIIVNEINLIFYYKLLISMNAQKQQKLIQQKQQNSGTFFSPVAQRKSANEEEAIQQKEENEQSEAGEKIQMKTNGGASGESGGGNMRIPTSATFPVVQRQESSEEELATLEDQQQESREITGAAVSISWIHPSSPAGSMVGGVPDPQPPSTISRGFVSAAQGFRFSNHVGVTITTSDGRTIDSVQHDPMQITKGSSQFGVPSQQFPTQRQENRQTRNGIEYIEVQQLVGARTVSHEAAGERVGNVVGGASGAYMGAKLLGGAGSFLGPLGTAAGVAIGGVGGYFLGGYLGEKAAATAISFPPIWTEITLRVFADGHVERSIGRHSHFPSVTFYGVDNYVSDGNIAYLALEAAQNTWQASGWGGGNPWGVNRYDGRD